MATIDLGRLGFVNKGTYNNSTTYEKNDLVQFTDGGVLSTYLYIDSTAQSGQAPSSSGTVGSRWVYFAKGVTDSLGSISNNNIVVKDNSGNITGLSGNNKIITTNNSGVPTALSIGSAGQTLKVNSGANGFEFGNEAGGGLRFISKHNLTSNSAEWIFDQIFANNTSYNIFKIYIYNLTHVSGSDDDIVLDLRRGSSGSESSMRSSYALMYHRDRRHGNAGQNNYLSTDSAAHGGFRFQHSGVDGAADNKPHYAVVTIFNPHKKDGAGNQVNMKTMMHVMTMGMTDGNGSGTHFYSGESWGMYDNDDQVATGFSLKSANYNLRASSGNQPMVLVFGISES